MSTQNPELARWFAEEVQPHEPALRSYLRTHFPWLTDIDDIVQDAYARLVQARRTGKVAEARPYLFATARNAAIDLSRRNRMIAKTAASFVVEPAPHCADTLDHDQELALLATAIETLPERCREVLTLRKLHGLSHRAIAERLGISENTVSAQITAGVFRVREYFKAQGVARTDIALGPRRPGRTH